MKKNKGQITIFVIIALLMIAGIALFFMVNNNLLTEMGTKSEKNPDAFLETCLEDSIKEGIETIEMHGGYNSNQLNKTFKFEEDRSATDIAYLCYNQNYYYPCVNQEPLLINHLEQELYSSISEEVDKCYTDLKNSLEKAGYAIEESYNGFEIRLEEGKVITLINAEMTSSKSGETATYNDFKVITASKLYNLANMAQEIINSEATTGEFSHYEIFNYPEFDITKYRTTDSSVIYRVIQIESDEEFRFAVRGAVIKAGWY